MTQANGAYEVRLSSKVLARDVYLSFGDHDAKFSDNYIDLLPGEPATIIVHSPASLAELQSSMKVMSLVDAIEPNTVWKSAAWELALAGRQISREMQNFSAFSTCGDGDRLAVDASEKPDPFR